MIVQICKPVDKLWFVTLISLIILLTGSPQRLIGQEVPEHFVPVRPMGMGGAFTAVANDETAVWTNPAGIARVRKARSRSTIHLAKFPNLIVGSNETNTALSPALKGQALTGGTEAASDAALDAITANHDTLVKNPFWARVAMAPIMLFDGGSNIPMAAGLFTNTRAQAVSEPDFNQETNLQVISDAGAVFTAAFTSKTNRLTAALQIRPIIRYAYEERLQSTDLLNKSSLKESLKGKANQSTGLGIDAGLLYTVADFWYPTIGLSALNLPTGCREQYLNPITETMETVCGNAYQGSFGNRYALSTVDPTDLRVGFSISPRLTRKLNLRLALDAHHIAFSDGSKVYGLTGINVAQIFHGGVEIFYGNPLKIAPLSFRAGYSQGLSTFGASLNLPFVSIGVASYGQNIAGSQNSVNDRRTVLSLSAKL